MPPYVCIKKIISGMKSIKSFLVSLLVVVILPGAVVYAIFVYYGSRKQQHVPVHAELRADHKSSVDHTQFEILQQKFEIPQEVTAACISCHNGRDNEIMATAHWKWERKEKLPGDRGEVTIGKKNLINNFCTGASGNNGSCMRCHIGYGWKDKSFDFSDPKNVDCLVCHDQTQTYKKQKGQAGMPATPETATPEFPVPDYNYVAQNVGLPDKHNCGVCHFYGGGGNNVKHGDLEESLLSCSFDVDVHMSSDSLNMACIDCHRTKQHNITGKLYSVSAMNRDRVTCEQCHTDKPHMDQVLDQHYNKVACQTCHIPVYAKVNATKLYWDWSSAGRLDEDGKPYVESDGYGNHNYLSIKGNFVWDDHVTPEYYWFNGTADHYLETDKIEKIPGKINTLMGSYLDSASRIWPVKVHRGKQIYDQEYKTLISLKLWAKEKGEGAYWKDFKWDTAAYLGMKYNERPYSGKYDFVKTEVYWPINHMVSPKDKALSCTECHSRKSRLANLKDFYLPGRDYPQVVETGAMWLIILTLIGVVGHGILRIVSSSNRK